MLDRYRRALVVATSLRSPSRATASAEGEPGLGGIDLGAPPPGWKVRSSEEPYPANAKGGSTGETGHLELSTTTPGPLAYRWLIRQTTTKVSSWDCPDAAGNAKGFVRFRNRVLMRLVNLASGRVSEEQTDIGYEGRFEAHVTDDALLKDYDLVVDVHRGKQAAHFVFKGLQPEQPWELPENDRTHISWGGSTGQEYNDWAIDGPGTKSVVLNHFPTPTTDDLFILAAAAKAKAGDAVKTAFDYWYEFALCVRVTYTPGGRSPGATIRVQIDRPTPVAMEARSVLDNALVRGHVNYSFDLGSVSPTSADLEPSGPGRIELVAKRKRQAPSQGQLRTDGVSRRGRVAGPLGVNPYDKPPLPRRWTGTVDGTSHQTSTAFDVTDSWSAQVTFTLFDQGGGEFDYEPTGTISYTTSGAINGCSVNGSGTHTLDPPDGFLRLLDQRVGTPPADRIDYDAFGLNEYGVNDEQGGHPVILSCPEAPPTTEDWRTQKPWIETGGYQQAPANAHSLSGTHTETGTGEETTWKWNLTADTTSAARSGG